MKQFKLEKTILYINFIAVIYFVVLALISYYSIEGTLFNVIAQIITIPLLLFLFFSLAYSTNKIITNKREKSILSIFILSSLSIIFLIILTIIQMR